MLYVQIQTEFFWVKENSKMVQVFVGQSLQIMEDLVGNGKNCRLLGAKWMLLQGFDKKSEAKWLNTVIFIGKQIVIDQEEREII